MTAPVHVLSARGKSGIVLRVSFVWWVDRFGHVISLATSPQRSASVLQSVEGDAQEPWPASPPLQSVSLEKLADGRQAALLVGMAGRSHWSASVETMPQQAALVFDVACRLTSQPGNLSSRYNVVDGQILSGPGDKQREYIEIRSDGPPVRIYREAVPDNEVKLRLPEPGELVIRPAIVVAGPNPTTIRWKYRIEVAEG